MPRTRIQRIVDSSKDNPLGLNAESPLSREKAFDSYDKKIQKQIQLEEKASQKAIAESNKIIAQKEREFWKKSGNKAIMSKIAALIEDIQLHPYEGIGKPEPLKYELSGLWSRRINKEHRIIYKVTEENTIEILDILSLKGHYE